MSTAHLEDQFNHALQNVQQVQYAVVVLTRTVRLTSATVLRCQLVFR